MKRFTWTPEAKADLRRMEPGQALDTPRAMARFGREGTEADQGIHVAGVENGKDAWN